VTVPNISNISRAWLSMAFFAAEHLQDVDRAEECLATADRLPANSTIRDREILAFREACSAMVLFGRHEPKDALLHLRKAFELDPTEARREAVMAVERRLAQDGDGTR
jgi:hypothetical protein